MLSGRSSVSLSGENISVQKHHPSEKNLLTSRTGLVFPLYSTQGWGGQNQASLSLPKHFLPCMSRHKATVNSPRDGISSDEIPVRPCSIWRHSQKVNVVVPSWSHHRMMSQPDPERGLEVLLCPSGRPPPQTACSQWPLACVSTGRQKVFVLRAKPS